MQWLIETSPRKPRWSVERMTGEILALWFSSVHQLAMVWLQFCLLLHHWLAQPTKTTTFALHDVCQYPEWAHELRLELDEASQKAMPVHPESLVLLDGFVQESVRVNTYDASESLRTVIFYSSRWEFGSQRTAKSYDPFCFTRRSADRPRRLGMRTTEGHDAGCTILSRSWILRSDAIFAITAIEVFFQGWKCKPTLHRRQP